MKTNKHTIASRLTRLTLTSESDVKVGSAPAVFGTAFSLLRQSGHLGFSALAEWRFSRIMSGLVLKSLYSRGVTRNGAQFIRRMAHIPTPEELGLKGWQYYFNAQTTSGRRNVVFAVYGTLFGIWGLTKLRKPKAEK